MIKNLYECGRMAMVVKFYYGDNTLIFNYELINKKLSLTKVLQNEIKDKDKEIILNIKQVEIELKDYSIVLSEPIITGADFLDIKWCKIAQIYPDGTEYSISSTFMTTKEFMNVLDNMVLV
mgnify:CR=1 FL=1